MKSIRTLSIPGLAIIGLTIVSTGCQRDDIVDTTPSRTDLSKHATVEIYNASPNTSRNFAYIDGKPLNVASITYNNSFPLHVSNVGLVVEPGSRSFLIKDTLATSTQPQIAFTSNLEAGKSYTLFMYDTVTAVKHLLVTNNIVVPTDSTARVRAAHFSFLKTGPIPAIDIFSIKKNANIFSNIAYGQVTDFISYPSAGDTLLVRQAGSTTLNLDTLTSFNPARQRSYTLVFTGRYMSNGSGGATLPRTLFSYTNY